MWLCVCVSPPQSSSFQVFPSSWFSSLLAFPCQISTACLPNRHCSELNCAAAEVSLLCSTSSCDRFYFPFLYLQRLLLRLVHHCLSFVRFRLPFFCFDFHILKDTVGLFSPLSAFWLCHSLEVELQLCLVLSIGRTDDLCMAICSHT